MKRSSVSFNNEIDDGALVPVSDVKRKVHCSFPMTITAVFLYFIK
jgi:hypothetical protein